eukprot:tig00021572_g22423.t1
MTRLSRNDRARGEVAHGCGSRTPTPLHDLPTTPKPASDTTAPTRQGRQRDDQEAKACLPPRPPVKALSPRDRQRRRAGAFCPAACTTAKLVTLHAAATWPPLASPMAPRPPPSDAARH